MRWHNEIYTLNWFYNASCSKKHLSIKMQSKFWKLSWFVAWNRERITNYETFQIDISKSILIICHLFYVRFHLIATTFSILRTLNIFRLVYHTNYDFESDKFGSCANEKKTNFEPKNSKNSNIANWKHILIYLPLPHSIVIFEKKKPVLRFLLRI